MQLWFNLKLLKGPLLGPKQFLQTESPLKIMKNSFYCTLKAFFVLKILKFVQTFRSSRKMV